MDKLDFSLEEIEAIEKMSNADRMNFTSWCSVTKASPWFNELFKWLQWLVIKKTFDNKEDTLDKARLVLDGINMVKTEISDRALEYDRKTQDKEVFDPHKSFISK